MREYIAVISPLTPELLNINIFLPIQYRLFYFPSYQYQSSSFTIIFLQFCSYNIFFSWVLLNYWLPQWGCWIQESLQGCHISSLPNNQEVQERGRGWPTVERCTNLILSVAMGYQHQIPTFVPVPECCASALPCINCHFSLPWQLQAPGYPSGLVSNDISIFGQLPYYRWLCPGTMLIDTK